MHSEAEGASPAVFLTEKDWRLRFCAEYQKVDLMTVGEFYQLSKMDECLVSLASALVFSTIRYSSVYMEIKFDKADG